MLRPDRHAGKPRLLLVQAHCICVLQESAPPTDLSEDQFKPPPMPAELQGSDSRFR